MTSRVSINLASEPFRSDRPLLAASIAVCVALAGLLALMSVLFLAEREQMAGTRGELAAARLKSRELSAEAARLQQVLRQPANAEVLDRSVFLNLLLKRKGISWTRLFSDLEKVMPHNVRLVTVRPAVTVENQVFVDMEVAAQSGEPVIDFLKRLEESAAFGNPAVASSRAPTQTEPFFRYRISVSYDQKF